MTDGVTFCYFLGHGVEDIMKRIEMMIIVTIYILMDNISIISV